MVRPTHGNFKIKKRKEKEKLKGGRWEDVGWREGKKGARGRVEVVV